MFKLWNYYTICTQWIGLCDSMNNSYNWTKLRYVLTNYFQKFTGIIFKNVLEHSSSEHSHFRAYYACARVRDFTYTLCTPTIIKTVHTVN